MIEFYLQTGNQATGDIYQIDGQISNGIGSIDSQDSLSNNVYINGQNFLERLAQVSTVGQREIIESSGHFFLSGFTLRNGTGFLDLEGFSEANLDFDVINSFESPFFEGDSNSFLSTGFSGVCGQLDEGESIFLNGIKLISGEHFNINANSNFEWIDSDVQTTGVLFAKKPQNQYNSTGSYDVVGVNFNKGTSIGYLNGLRLGNSDFLETSSILEGIIQTGLNDKLEFNSKPEVTTIFL